MGSPRHPNVSEILEQVHQQMASQYLYSPMAQQEIGNAALITNFLRELKSRAFSRKTVDNKVQRVKEDLYDLILDNIQLPNGRTIYKLFSRTGDIGKVTGQYFEDDLAAALASLINLTKSRDQKITYKNLSIGSSVGTTDLDLLKHVQKFTEEEIKEIQELTGEEFRDDRQGLIMGKIDTFIEGKLVNLNAEIDIPDNLLEALSNATFSDKSYKSISWKKGSDGKFHAIDLGDRIIHLGNSNPYRAILGSMASLGWTRRDAQYIYYGGRNIIAGKDQTPPPERPEHVKLHTYHLRYIYELTGQGIYYKDYGEKFFGGVKYLVYNDPTSEDIICISVYQIIRDILDESKNLAISNEFASINIPVSKIKSLANLT